MINVPPSPDISSFAYILADTQLNLLDGGSIGQFVDALSGSTVNILGGLVGSFFEAYGGSVINISRGSVGGFFQARGRSVINISGGTVGEYLRAETGSTISISGGTGEGTVRVHPASVVNVSGGWVGRINVEGRLNISGGVADVNVHPGGLVNISGGLTEFTYADGTVNFYGGIIKPLVLGNGGAFNVSGGEFRLNGEPIVGLDVIGKSVQLDMSIGDVVSGTLAEGTPFAFNESAYDHFSKGMLTLKAAAIPSNGPTIITASVSTIPGGIRNAQSLIVDAGGETPEYFQAGWGSAVKVIGGRAGGGLEAVGASVTIDSGSIDRGLGAYFGSKVYVHGGIVGEGFRAFAGSTVHIAGGMVAPDFAVYQHSELTIEGGEFRIDGVPLANPTAMVKLNNSILSGTFADGTPFTSQGWRMSEASLTLHAADLPGIGPSLITASIDQVARGIRSGQTLVVDNGAQVADYFIAGWDSAVQVSGGNVGLAMQATHAHIEVLQGSIGARLHATLGSNIHMSGGAIGRNFFADRGSTVTITGGTLGERSTMTRKAADGSGTRVSVSDEDGAKKSPLLTRAFNTNSKAPPSASIPESVTSRSVSI